MSTSSNDQSQPWVAKRLGDVLAAAEKAEPAYRPYFQSEERLRDEASGDHVLYRARRDIERAFADVGRRCTWRIDQLEISADDLPSGELNRSVGHWNPADQVEVFQIDEGAVVMVLASPGASSVSVLRCPQGSLVALRPEMWHLTYAVEGRAVVSNIYSQSAEKRGAKYFTRSPVRVGVRRGSNGIEVVVPERSESRLGLDFGEAPATRDVVGSLSSLRELFLDENRRLEQLANLLALL